MLYDVFISHASENKDTFVRPLAEKLAANNLEIWYDEFSLVPGDGLRKSIDQGLANSRYGIVVLSKDFFGKHWTNWELDGLVQRHLYNNENVIIPIWLDLKKEDVAEYSLPLANIVAINASIGIVNVVNKLLKVIKPSGSSLIIARDILINFGVNPPVVTDDWWHKAIEYCGSNMMEDTFQSSMGWGRWGFPLPERNDTVERNGERIAWSAMQLAWMEDAEENKITQITEPEKVHEYINRNSGLLESCSDFPAYLATYAPQLTIPGYGGNFEKNFDTIIAEFQKDKQRENEVFALHEKEYTSYKPSFIACNYVQGQLNGPSVKYYEYFDYLVFFLSSKTWMPDKYRVFLLDGMINWSVWFSTNEFIEIEGIYNDIYEREDDSNFSISQKAIDEISVEIERSIKKIEIVDTKNNILEAFLEYRVLEKAREKVINRKNKKT